MWMMMTSHIGEIKATIMTLSQSSPFSQVSVSTQTSKSNTNSLNWEVLSQTEHALRRQIMMDSRNSVAGYEQEDVG